MARIAVVLLLAVLACAGLVAASGAAPPRAHAAGTGRAAQTRLAGGPTWHTCPRARTAHKDRRWGSSSEGSVTDSVSAICSTEPHASNRRLAMLQVRQALQRARAGAAAVS